MSFITRRAVLILKEYRTNERCKWVVEHHMRQCTVGTSEIFVFLQDCKIRKMFRSQSILGSSRSSKQEHDILFSPRIRGSWRADTNGEIVDFTWTFCVEPKDRRSHLEISHQTFICLPTDEARETQMRIFQQKHASFAFNIKCHKSWMCCWETAHSSLVMSDESFIPI